MIRCSGHVRADGSANHSSADGTLRKTRGTALADGQMATGNEHHCPRRVHTYTTQVCRERLQVLRVCVKNVLCRRAGAGARVRAAQHVVQVVPPQLLGERHDIGVRVDVSLALPFLVGPEALEQLLS